jgi:Na+/glutamate symporter
MEEKRLRVTQCGRDIVYAWQRPVGDAACCSGRGLDEMVCSLLGDIDRSGGGGAAAAQADEACAKAAGQSESRSPAAGLVAWTAGND